MKHVFLIILSTVLVSFQAMAGETLSLPLTLPPDFSSRACPAPVWNSKALWGGVKDLRDEKSVGHQTIKGGSEEVARVESTPALDQILDISLKRLFQTCGLQWVASGDETTSQISVDILEFFAGSDKKFLTGQGRATSRLAIHIQKGRQTLQTLEVGFQIENKGLRQSKLKQLQKTLNELLAETLTQIPRLPQLRSL